MNPISLMLAPARWGFGLVADAAAEIQRQFRLLGAPERHASLAPAVDLTPPVEPDQNIPPQATLTPPAEAGPGLPVQNYDQLSAVDAVSAVKTLNSMSDLQALSRHERITKDRVSVVRAINDREAELASVEA